MDNIALNTPVAETIAPTIDTVSVETTAAAGTTIFSTPAFKVAAAIVTAALVVGGVIIGTQFGHGSGEDIAPDISCSAPSVPLASSGDPALGEAHPFQHYAFDDDAHWLICECEGATDTRLPHSFVSGDCTVCCMPEPLPGGNPYLTYDTRLLGGHWLCMSPGTVGDAADDFYINGDGSLYMNGKTYYPVGSMYGDAPVGEPCPLLINFRETPYDPDVGITKMEAYNTPIMLELKSTDDLTVINLSIIDTNVYIVGKYYRENA